MSHETRQKTRILLADGHRLVRQGIRRILDSEPDFEVVGEADNGDEVVKLAQQLSPNIIVMEARLGRVDSIEATRRVKAQQPAAAVVVLTAYDDAEYIGDMIKAGAGGCLPKSIDAERLAEAIRFVRQGIFVCDPTMEQRILKQAARPRPVPVEFGQHLTRRETEVLKLAARGLNNRDIASCLGLTEGTVKAYLGNILGKMGVRSRTEAVLEALKRGWVSLENESAEVP